MTNQTLILCTVVLCSLGGWYVVLSKYFELKAAIKKPRAEQNSMHKTAPNRDMRTQSANKVAESEPLTLSDNFEFPEDVDYSMSNHIPGMGPPPLANLPFQIPPEVMESMRRANFNASPVESAQTKIQQPAASAPSKSSPIDNGAKTNTAVMSKRDVCNWASILHLSGLGFVTGIPFINIIVPAILWLLKKEQHPYLAKQGREVLNFQITFTLIQFLCLGAGALFIWLMPNTAAGLFAWTKTLRIVFITGMHLPFNIFTALPFFWGCMLVVRGTVAAYHGIAFKYPHAQLFLTESQVNPTYPKQTAPVMQRKEPRVQPESPLPKGMNKISFG